LTNMVELTRIGYFGSQSSPSFESLSCNFNIRERNIKENRFRFSLKAFGRKPCLR